MRKSQTIRKKNIFKGLTFLLTRDRDSNRELSVLLKQKSARVILWPSYSFEQTPLSSAVKTELNNIHDYDWLIFTSVRTVDFFVRQFLKIHKNFSALKNVQIAAVGSKTAERIYELGLKVHLIPKEKSALGLVREKVFHKNKNLKIFIPQAADARQEFVKEYRKKHQIVNVVFYQKKEIRHLLKKIESLKQKKIDWVLFYSPSAVTSFLAGFKRKTEGVKILKQSHLAVIGETTAKHLNSLNLKAHVVSKQSTTEDLLTGIERFSLRNIKTR